MNEKIYDMDLNQNAKLEPIIKVAKKIGINKKQLITYGEYKAKIDNFVGEMDSKLILVTSINPTKAGEGKTTISIGLSDSLNRMGYKTILALREPSLGPVFGVKGGATGGGYSQVAPMDEINFHFTGDIHAITSANNLIAAMIDNHIHWGNELKIKKTTFKKCIDMNDRTLRKDFQITAASEIMSVFTLANDLEDLRKRIDKIVIGSNNKNEPIFVESLNITGSVVALLKDAFKPNLVQTLENNPVLIHGGPFANISHGCNSVVATKLAMSLGDVTVTEAGFGSDLGAEKFLNIISRQGDLNPNLVVMVATIKSLKMHGGVSEKKLSEENIEALVKGLELLGKHFSNMIDFNMNCVIALNEFSSDRQSEKEIIREWAEKKDIPLAFSTVWENGSLGGEELSNLVLQNISEKKVEYTYRIEEEIKIKIEKIAKLIYGAADVSYSKKAEESIKFIEKNQMDKQFICIAKTQSSISDNVKLKGIPDKWTLNVKDVKISNGSGFIVVYCGPILTMPGLSKNPQAEKIDFDGENIIKLD